jgi:hypothetical protein
MARRKKSMAFSLFAFQDIITSVTGIMVLVTLILALELIQQKESSPPVKTAQVVSQTRAAVAQNEVEIQQLQSRLETGREQMAQVAAFDATHVSQQLKDLKELNDDLDRELDEYAEESEAAARRKDEAKAEQDRRSSDSQTLEQLTADVKKETELIEKLRKSNRTIFKPPEGASKTPWLVEVSGEGLIVAQWGVSAPPKRFQNPAELRDFAAGRDKGSEYFVLLVKPAGIENFGQARSLLKRAGFDVGFDLLRTDQSALDPETGAAVQ